MSADAVDKAAEHRNGAPVPSSTRAAVMPPQATPPLTVPPPTPARPRSSSRHASEPGVLPATDPAPWLTPTVGLDSLDSLDPEVDSDPGVDSEPDLPLVPDPAPDPAARRATAPMPERSSTGVTTQPTTTAQPMTTTSEPAVGLTGSGPGQELIAHLDAVLAGLDQRRPSGPARPGADPLAEQLLRLFDAQAGSRWLDVAARRMRAVGLGHYTIGSAGHEANAAIALALRVDDPALLHYRSGAFYLARSAQPRRTGALASGVGRGLLDVALGLAASSGEPIAGGRHKVFGHPELGVIPQTSTIASHLPRALGIAWSLGRQQRLPERLRTPLHWPDDALVVASFGDASANHSTAAGAINAACWTAHQQVPLPLLLVCEDNGLGISTRTPGGWVAAAFERRQGLEYRYDDGSDPVASLQIATEAAAAARNQARPVLLHLRCVRIGGHAGSDVESSYRAGDEISADLDRDPLSATLRTLVDRGVLSADEVRSRWLSIRDEVTACVEEAMRCPGLTDVEQVMAPLAPRRPAEVSSRVADVAPERERLRMFGRLPETEAPLTLAQAINRTLQDAGAHLPGLLVLGQDVARKGGVYGVTRGLLRKLGASRVIDTLLDEQTVLGMALGAGISGLLPVPEIQYLAYLHNAEDQLRGEAASLQFFSQGAFRNPLVVRVPGLAYQKGFGGHFHNDNSLAVLRDVPGLVIACPAHPSDAPAILRTCLAAARADGTVSVVIEPIALYHERDMLTPGDGAWLASYAPPSVWEMAHVPIGRAATWGTGTDLTIVTFGNGLRMSMRVADRLAKAGVGVRVVDLRWLAPLPIEDVLREARVTGRCLIVDETRRTGGVAEGLVTELMEAGFQGKLGRIAADDSFVPLGQAADLVLISEADIEDAARTLLHP